MYDELVKRLHRYTENCVAYKLDADFADAVQKAADAIEELNLTHDESAAYQRGLDDAWEAARKVFGMTIQELYDAFGEDGLCLLQKTTVAEALARIRAYEESQEIHVGDEVTCEGFGGKAVVTFLNDEDGTILHWPGGMSYVKKDRLTKTGRHFPEVAALLDKMKE